MSLEKSNEQHIQLSAKVANFRGSVGVKICPNSLVGCATECPTASQPLPTTFTAVFHGPFRLLNKV